MNDENCQLETHNDTIKLSPIYFRPSIVYLCVKVSECGFWIKLAFGFDKMRYIAITQPKIDILD